MLDKKLIKFKREDFFNSLWKNEISYISELPNEASYRDFFKGIAKKIVYITLEKIIELESDKDEDKDEEED